MTLQEIQKLIQTQKLNWVAGETPIANNFDRKNFGGFGLSLSDDEEQLLNNKNESLVEVFSQKKADTRKK